MTLHALFVSRHVSISHSCHSARNSTIGTGEPAVIDSHQTLSRSVCRCEDWNTQNASRVGDSRNWNMLVSVAADALICATGGFVTTSKTQVTAAAAPAAAAAAAASHPLCPVQKVPVFAEPFAALKKSQSTTPSVNVELDTSFLSAFVYNKACMCK